MVSRYVSNYTLAGVGPGPGNGVGHPQHTVAGAMPLSVALAANAAVSAAAQIPANLMQQQQQAAAVHQQQQQQQKPQAQPNSQQQVAALKGHNPNDYHSGVQQCIVQGVPPQQHPHFRLLHSRSDGYVAAPSTGYTAPQSGPPHQGPQTVLRSMQSTTPQNQSQQQDLSKMQQPTQQMIMSTNKKKKYQQQSQQQYQINKSFGPMSILTTNSSSNHIHNLTNPNSCQINTSTSSGLFGVNSSGVVSNNGCVDRKFDIQIKSKLINNNTFQTTAEFVPSGGSNNAGNVRPNQQGNMYRSGAVTSAPRGGPRNHVAIPITQYPPHVVMPPYQSYPNPRQPTSLYASGTPFQFQQHMQPNFSFPYYFPNPQLLTTATTASHHAHQRGPGGVPGGIGVPNGQLGGPGAAQLAMPGAGVLTAAQGTVPPPGVGQPGLSAGSGVSGPTIRKKRTHAIDIINPTTNKNVLDEIEQSKVQESAELHYSEQMVPNCADGIIPGQDCSEKVMQRAAPDMVSSTTPVVSAMSDAPSVDIPNSQQPKRKNKSIPIVSPSSVEDNRTQAAATTISEEIPVNNPQVTSENPADATAPALEPSQTTASVATPPVEDAAPAPAPAPSTATDPIPQAAATEFSASTAPPAPTCTSSASQTTTTPDANELRQMVEKMALSDKDEAKVEASQDKPASTCINNNNSISTSKFSNDTNENRVDADETDRSASVAAVEKDLANNNTIDPSNRTDKDATTNGSAADDAVAPESTEPAPATTAAEKPAASASQQPLIEYREGQWSPSNPAGDKKYDRNQLLALKQAPGSRAKPDVNSKITAILFRSSQPNLMPSFVRNNKQTKSMVGAMGNMGYPMGGQGSNSYMKQASMPQANARNSSRGSKQGIIHLNLSLREDVKLNETENAWRPNRQAKDTTQNAELKRAVRGILNKLTPEKFETLTEQILKLQIDSNEKVNDVMILVFEKAIDEPNFSKSYARLCQCLAAEAKAKDESSAKEINQIFRTALLDKTEREFTENITNCVEKEQKLKPILKQIKECTDPEKLAELKGLQEDEERKLRRRSGGTVRFIGELYKISMLTTNIIQMCILKLLNARTEDKLECLCKLLTTVGQKIEQTKKNNKFDLDNVFKEMQNITDKKTSDKISSRVRFMLQDVIDLRKTGWVSKQEVPKTMEQIQKDAATEQMSNQYLNYNSMGGNAGGNVGPKKDDRRYGGAGSGSGSYGGGRDSGNYRRQQQGSGSNDEWHVQTSKGSRVVDPNKLTMMRSNIDQETKLGTSTMYVWDHVPTKNNARPAATTSNPFAVLSGLESNKGSQNGFRGNNKGSYNKGSMERDRYDMGMYSRTGSANGSRENSTSRNQPPRMGGGSSNGGGMSHMQKSASHQNATHSSSSMSSSRSTTAASLTSDNKPATPPASQYPQAPPPAVFGELDDDTQYNNELKKMIDIALNSNMDDIIPILKAFPENMRWAFIYVIFSTYLHLANVKEHQRKAASNIVQFLIKTNFISLEHFAHGYREFVSIAADMMIDIPEAWHYIFQFAGPLISKKIITVNDLWTKEMKDDGLGRKFLKEFLLYCTREIGPDYTRSMWKSFELKWTDFIDEEDVDSFIKTNKFEYVEDVKSKPEIVISGKEDKEKYINKLMERVKELLNDGANTDAIIDYLRGNVVDVDKQFIRSLTKTLCNHAISFIKGNYKFDSENFKLVCPILQRYLDSREERELECLYAMQLLINSLEHPAGLLNELFGSLYDDDVIPQETFIKWRDSKEEQQAGKGVAIKGLNPFFNNISGETSDENN